MISWHSMVNCHAAGIYTCRCGYAAEYHCYNEDGEPVAWPCTVCFAALALSNDVMQDGLSAKA